MSTFASNETLNLAIIAYAKARPPIWNNDGRYSQIEREAAWKSFSEGFSLPISELKSRWEGMRQKYCKHLMESVSTGVEPVWIYFSKLDPFLREKFLQTSTARPQDGTMPAGETVKRAQVAIECIELDSDSDAEPNNSARVMRVDKPLGGVKLQTPDDVKKELRKIPPVSTSSGALRISSGSSGQHSGAPRRANSSFDSHRSSLGKKHRKSLPAIPDAKKRLIENCGELIALKKVDPLDNLPRVLPAGNSSGNSSNVSSSAHKMFGSSSPNTAPNRMNKTVSGVSGKSLLKKMRRDWSHGTKERTAKKHLKRKSTGSPATANSHNSDPRRQEIARIPKLPAGTALSAVTSSSEPSKGTALLPPTIEEVTVHSFSTTPKVESKNKDNPPSKDHKRRNKKPHERTSISTDKSQLDKSSADVSNAKKSSKESNEPCSKIALDPVKPTSPKTVDDIWTKWEKEVAELRKTDGDCKQEDESDPEAETEIRKDFLLSLLPDMAEMTVEQTRFFKSKLLYLVCNIEQFS